MDIIEASEKEVTEETWKITRNGMVWSWERACIELRRK